LKGKLQIVFGNFILTPGGALMHVGPLILDPSMPGRFNGVTIYFTLLRLNIAPRV